MSDANVLKFSIAFLIFWISSFERLFVVLSRLVCSGAVELMNFGGVSSLLLSLENDYEF